MMNISELTIRHSEETDLEGIFGIYAQRHAYADTLQLPYPSKQIWRQRLSEANESIRSLVAEFDGRIVGHLGLIIQSGPRRKHSAQFGMAVCKSCLRQGVGSALMEACLEMADNWLNIHRLELEVYARNAAAIAMYKKYAFVQEGYCRDYAFRDGRYEDVLVMARLRPGTTSSDVPA